jgi:hypothetical protein
MFLESFHQALCMVTKNSVAKKIVVSGDRKMVSIALFVGDQKLLVA